MNICAVVTRETEHAVEEAINRVQGTLLDVCVDGVDRRDAAVAMNMQVKSRPDILILDLTVQLAYAWTSIYRVRIGSPDTRLVILSESDNDPILSQCLHTGIYDIIIKSAPDLLAEQICNAILHPANYAEASKYAGMPAEEPKHSSPRPFKSQIMTQEVLVIEERPVGNVSIAVASIQPRTGSTTLSLAIAQMLERKGLRTVLWLNSPVHFAYMQEAYNDVKITDPGQRFTLDGLDICAGMDVPEIGDYPYTVLDLGTYNTDSAKEFRRATVRILLSGTKDWELPAIDKFLSDALARNENLQSYIYGFVHTSEKVFADLAKEMKGMQCICVPEIYDPMEVNHKLEEAVAPALAAYLPCVTTRTKGATRSLGSFFSWPKKK